MSGRICYTYMRYSKESDRHMIDRLEKKFGRFAIKNLIFYVLGGYVIGYILYILYTSGSSNIYSLITLNPAMVMQGQVWRLFTWVLTIPQALSFWVIFMFLFYFFIGRSLEQSMGAFRYNIYMFSGWFFMTLGAMAVYWITKAAGTPISMNVSTYYINMASFLAFAVLFPDVRVYFFGILPIKIKVLAWIDVGLLALSVLQDVSALILILSRNSALVQEAIASSGMSEMYAQVLAYYSVAECVTGIFSIFISLLNFLVFFLMNRKKRVEARKRRAEYEKKAAQGRAAYSQGSAFGSFNAQRQEEPKRSFRPAQGPEGLIHRCEICGRSSLTNPELQFRYCSKCEGSHEYCQDHLFTHVHKK